MDNGRNKTLISHKSGQSMIEFALILPLFVLIVIGVFDLGRAFFAYIAISNAAREGARVYTFSPDTTTREDIDHAVHLEIGTSSVVNQAKIDPHILIQCVDPNDPNPNTNFKEADTNTKLKACKSYEPIRVTVYYTQDLILSFFFPDGLTLERSAEMMVP
jgi:Flp pilus assembly protein TadG